jgi:predicted nucleotidyltransferase
MALGMSGFLAQSRAAKRALRAISIFSLSWKAGALMDLGGFLSALQELLDAEVDVATERLLRPNVRERALRDATPL